MSLSESSGRTLKSGPLMQFVLQRILGGLAATFLLVLMLLTLVDVALIRRSMAALKSPNCC